MFLQKIKLQIKNNQLIEASSGLTDDDIEKMKRDAEEHSKEDKAKREEIDLRNNADQLVYQTEKQLEDLGDKVDKDSKEQILELVNEVKSLKDSQDSDKLKEAVDSLNKKWAEVSQKIYSSEQQGNASSDQGSNSQNSSSEDNDVEDADFEVVDDEEK